MDGLFGVVNIPNVVWIDEQGVIVRPAEAGWPDVRQELPDGMMQSRPKLGRAKHAPQRPSRSPGQRAVLASGQDRESYPGAIRDWVAEGCFKPVRPQPLGGGRPLPAATAGDVGGRRPLRAGRPSVEVRVERDLALEHFRECHRLQPDNWTYKRQAWSLVGNERVGGRFGRFIQGPLQGEEDDWPFESDFRSDVSVLAEGAYYPKTL